MSSIDSEVQQHIRECQKCEVVVNIAGQPRVLACGWWYAHGCIPPWPPQIDPTVQKLPILMSDAVRAWDERYRAKEGIIKAIEEGCPTYQWLKKPCFACVAAAERVRKCLA